MPFIRADEHASNADSHGMIRRVEDCCDAQQLRFTPIRRQVFELVIAQSGAVKAYELIDLFSARTRQPAKPPTIYRALEFLLENQFIHRIESLNAFVCCAHVHGHRGCQFFICECCGSVQETHVPAFDRAIEEATAQLGFAPKHQAIELTGICATCQ